MSLTKEPARSRAVAWMVLCLAGAGVSGAAGAETPDFSGVDDILQGQRHLLRNDDLVVSLDHLDDVGSDRSHFGNVVLKTENLRVSGQSRAAVIDPGCILKKAADTSEKARFTNVFHSRIGRVFDLDRDVTVTLAPAQKSNARGCPGKLGLYIQDHVESRNNSLTAVDNSGPFWTQLLLADFNQDGFDDIFQFHSSSGTNGGFALHTAVDVGDPSKGLKRVNFAGMPADMTAVTGVPVSGDFNADGALDIAWLGAKPENNARLSIYFLSVCPRAGVKVLGVSCERAFSLVPADTRQLTAKAIKTDLRLEWPAVSCSGCSASTHHFGLAAGNFDGRLSSANGRAQDELVLLSSSIHTGAFDMWSYRFGADLAPAENARKTDLSKTLGGGVTFFLASGAVNQFRQADQIAVATNGFQDARLGLIDFDSGLQAKVRVLDVRRDAFFGNRASVGGEPFPIGVAIGRFDAPVKGGADSDFNSQVAVLYEVRDFAQGHQYTVVQVYTVAGGAQAKPVFHSEHVLANEIFYYGVLVHYAPLQAGDLRGRSLLLGEPSTFQVESHIQPSVILGSPPQHADYITPIGANEPAVFNFSALKKDYHSVYTVKVTDENQSSSRSTTSTGWSLEQESQIKGKTTFGPVEVEGELHQSLDIAEKNTVGKTFNTYASKSFDASTATGFGDQVWYSSKRINVYLYPVIGQYRCPQDKPRCSDAEKVQLTATFSGPDNVVSNISASGRTLEWYQPVHVPGQIFTYPWDQAQLMLQAPELKALGQTDTGAFYTDDSTRTTNVTWSGGGSGTQSVGFASSWSLGGGFSVSAGTPEEAYKKAGGVRGSVGLDMAYSSGLETLNTDTHKIGASTGITVKKPGTFPSATGYQFLVKPFIFGAGAPAGQTQNLKPDADILTHGPLRTVFAADPTAAASGSWWSSGDYRRAVDIGFGFPARWEIVDKANKAVIDTDTACRGAECAVAGAPDAADLWNSAFYWLRGFYIKADGAGPQRVAARAGDSMELSVRVYNHSFMPVDPAQHVKVRFYAQPWDTRVNRPLQGVDSFLVGQDALPAIPGFAGGSEPNWNVARTRFDTSRCPGGCAGKYFIFWCVVWLEDGSGSVVRDELAGHGLNRQLSTEALQALLNDDTPSMHALLGLDGDGGLLESVVAGNGKTVSFSNNAGYYHQVFYVHPGEHETLRSRAAVQSSGRAAESPSQGAVTIHELDISPARIGAGETAELSAVLRTGGDGNSAVQALVQSSGPGGAPVLLDHELIAHIKPGQDYRISVPLRPTGCGRQVVEVRIDTGEPGATGTVMASGGIEVDC